ncbi:hypothetical protein GQX73_g8273 [Xylaria multiplex]|uniref:Rhodopsin domain-containing protein n=1 Tax=Xylaria multiplex TaxID=323545 RepID=A0A7C8IML1_9PEZI|nr:hypothetical protein GQX73_g8273 [Xylaria multiplex]
MDLDGPVLPPPDGVESNLDNPPNGNALVIGLTSFFLSIALIFIVLRIYAKTIYLKNKPDLGDYVILPGIGTYIAGCIFCYRVALTSGFFVHGWDFRLRDQSWFYYNLFLGTQMYLASMIFVKSAILLEWARIFGPGSRSAFRLTCYVLAVLNAIYYTINISLEVTSCRPRAFYWDKTIPGGRCVYNGPALSLTSALINLLFDLAILLLPQGIIWRLNMSRRKRVGVSAVFIVGLGACTSAILRIVFGVAYVTNNDYTYLLSPQSILCIAEVTAGILVFAAPATPKPVVYLVKQAGSSVDRLLRSTRGSASGVDSGTERSEKDLYSRKKPSSNPYDRDLETDTLQLTKLSTSGDSNRVTMKDV